jgi:hypothetical protein
VKSPVPAGLCESDAVGAAEDSPSPETTETYKTRRFSSAFSRRSDASSCRSRYVSEVRDWVPESVDSGTHAPLTGAWVPSPPAVPLRDCIELLTVSTTATSEVKGDRVRPAVRPPATAGRQTARTGPRAPTAGRTRSPGRKRPLAGRPGRPSAWDDRREDPLDAVLRWSL